MRPQDILEALRQQPFRPFRIHLSNGNMLDVRHPEMVMVGRSTVVIFYPASDEPSLFDRYETVALLHINRLEPLTPPAQPIAP